MRGGKNLSNPKFNEKMNVFFLEKEKDVDDEQMERLFKYYKRNHNIDKLKKTLSMTFHLAPNATVKDILDEWDNMEDTSFLSEDFSSDENNEPFPSFTPTSEVSSHASNSHNLGMGIMMKKRMKKKNKTNKKRKTRTNRKSKKNHRKRGGGASYTCDQDKNQLNFKQSE